MSKSQTVWVVGKITKWLVKDKITGYFREAKVYENHVECFWEFVGVSFVQQKAEEMCLTPNYFVGPFVIGQDMPTDTVDWPGGYFPKWGSDVPKK